MKATKVIVYRALLYYLFWILVKNRSILEQADFIHLRGNNRYLLFSLQLRFQYLKASRIKYQTSECIFKYVIFTLYNNTHFTSSFLSIKFLKPFSVSIDC